MARFYGLQVRTGIIALEEVPKLWRTMTEKWLEVNPAD